MNIISTFFVVIALVTASHTECGLKQYHAQRHQDTYRDATSAIFIKQFRVPAQTPETCADLQAIYEAAEALEIKAETLPELLRDIVAQQTRKVAQESIPAAVEAQIVQLKKLLNVYKLCLECNRTYVEKHGNS